eukprot:1157442-Pelagomonas_calceolata.AAC.12
MQGLLEDQATIFNKTARQLSSEGAMGSTLARRGAQGYTCRACEGVCPKRRALLAIHAWLVICGRQNGRGKVEMAVSSVKPVRARCSGASCNGTQRAPAMERCMQISFRYFLEIENEVEREEVLKRYDSKSCGETQQLSHVKKIQQTQNAWGGVCFLPRHPLTLLQGNLEMHGTYT